MAKLKIRPDSCRESHAEHPPPDIGRQKGRRTEQGVCKQGKEAPFEEKGDENRFSGRAVADSGDVINHGDEKILEYKHADTDNNGDYAHNSRNDRRLHRADDINQHGIGRVVGIV